MPSQDTFFKVKTGLGVGTDTFYASVADQKVSIGKTTGNFTLDVNGSIRTEENVLVDNRVGVGTTVPLQQMDVRGSAIISNSVGIGTTLPVQSFQVNSINNRPVVVTGLGSLGVNVAYPSQPFQVVGTASSRPVVISGFGSLGVGTLTPYTDFHLVSSETNTNFIINEKGFVGVNTLNPDYDVDVNGDLRVVGLSSLTDAYIGVATVGFATISESYLGITTVGLATISNSYLGITTVGFATISNSYLGITTVGFATISNSYLGITTVGIATIDQSYIGIATVGFATISESYLGITTVGFATISNSYLGITTVGFATISNSYLGITTVGFATISNSYLGITTVGFATIRESYVGITTISREFVDVSTIDELLVTGITTTALLDVGIGATLATFKNLGVTSVTSNTNELLKNIQPIVGIATTLPTRTLDVAGDLRVRGEVIDANNNVGFAYSVLGSQALGISGRFVDAANLLIRNKDFIASEVVGFITSVYGPFGSNGPAFDYGTAGLVNGPVKCKRDLGLIIDAIAFDISRGGNSQSVGAGLSYYAGVTLQHLDDSPTPPSGFSPGYVKQATIAGISSIKSIAQFVINNVQYPTSYQYGPYYNRNSDAANLIESNKDFIAQYAVAKLLNDNPSFTIPTGNDTCIRDIKLVLDAIIYNLRYTGNDRVWDAANLYAQNDYLLGEETESIEAYENARDAAISVMRNQLVNTSGISSPYSNIITKTQLVDNSIVVDPISPTCANVASAITTFIAIVTQAINTQDISNITRTPAIQGKSQLIDLEIAADGDSNANVNGCANVLSAIHSCVGIVTTIIDQGPSVAPKVNYPAGKLTWQPPGARIGNEWFVNKLGSDSNGGTGPGDAFLTIKRAAASAQPGDTIRVYAGLYIEDGPILFNERVAIVGEDLRRTLVTTRDKTDLFYVKRGCYVAGMSFVGEPNPGKAMVSFPTQGFGYADGTEENWQSPYVQNCTNFVPDSIGMRIDGNRAGGFKSMVLDAYTQYNQGGIGVSITNFGYAQLVSLFTICCDIAVYTDTGGVCDLNNSNSSFGNFGLWANGATPLQYTGTVTKAPEGETVSTLEVNVGVGASQEFIDSVVLLRENKDFIASEVVGFITSTGSSQVFPGVTPPFPGIGNTFDYGGSERGREFCRRDSKIIIEQICSDILTLGNKNSIDAGFAYRDSPDGSLTYLGETNPPPVGFSTGYVKNAEIAAIKFIAGISTYIVRNQPVPFTFQAGVGTFSQNYDNSLLFSSNIDSFISNRAGIITSIIGIGTTAAPSLILPKGQRPYDGQIAVIDTQYYLVSRIQITNPGSGYDPTVPVEVTISLPPSSEEFFIPAEAAIFENNINSDGTIASVDVIVSGNGYTSTPPTVTIDPPPGPGIQATAVAVMDKIFFNPISATPVSVGGTTTVTFDEFITYSPLIGVGSTVYFYQSSKIIASSITFEYVGTGINIVNAIPSKGAVPIDENQIVATNGGKVPFTSTDQSGDFRISEGITINQNTGTISGQAFSKSLQAEVTPLIIALQQ